jgi:hypothetical protein
MPLAIRRRLTDRMKRERSRDQCEHREILSEAHVWDAIGPLSCGIGPRKSDALSPGNLRCPTLTVSAMSKILAKRIRQASNAWPIHFGQTNPIVQCECLRSFWPNEPDGLRNVARQTQGNSGLACRRGEACLAPTAGSSRGSVAILAKRTKDSNKYNGLNY